MERMEGERDKKKSVGYQAASFIRNSLYFTGSYVTPGTVLTYPFYCNRKIPGLSRAKRNPQVLNPNQPTVSLLGIGGTCRFFLTTGYKHFD